MRALPESANETEGANETEDAPEPLGTVKGPWMKVAQSGADGEGELWKNKLTGKLRTDSPDYGDEISLKARGRIPKFFLNFLRKTGRIPPCVAATVPEANRETQGGNRDGLHPQKGKFDGKEKQALLDAPARRHPAWARITRATGLRWRSTPGRTIRQVQSLRWPHPPRC